MSNADTVAPPRAIWNSRIVGLTVPASGSAVVPIVASEPSLFHFKLRSPASLRLAITDAASSRTVHPSVHFRRMVGGDFRCIGSFETKASVMHLIFESLAGGKALVHGEVRIEPLSEVRSYDVHQRRLLLQSEISRCSEQLCVHQRDASDCAARAHTLRTTLLELQQALEIAAQ
ncbi:MAG: hypothetical protein SGPRY_002331, partial [Prymnesium sp.]